MNINLKTILQKLLLCIAFIFGLLILNKNIFFCSNREFIPKNMDNKRMSIRTKFLGKNVLVNSDDFRMREEYKHPFYYNKVSVKSIEDKLFFSNNNIIEDKHDFEYFLLSIVAKPYFEEKLSNMKKMRKILDSISKKYKVDLKLDYAYKYGNELYYMNFKVNKKENIYFLTNINENMAAKIIKESIQKKTQIEDIDAKKIFDNISEPVVIVTANKDIINEIHKKLNDNKIKVIF
jgi:hypothetical protein